MMKCFRDLYFKTINNLETNGKEQKPGIYIEGCMILGWATNSEST
jgi:hypothetical protein